MISKSILKYHEESSKENYMAVLSGLREAELWIPMTVSASKADEDKFLNAKQGDTVTTEDSIHMKPDILKDEKGILYLPVFTDQAEAPEDYRKHFSWIQISFTDCCAYIVKSNECGGIAVNAFSYSFTVTKDLAAIMIGARTTEHTLKKGEEIALVPFGRNSGHSLMAGAVRFLEDRPYVRKAYFALLRRDREESYLFVVDAPGENPKELFSQMNSVLQEELEHSQVRRLPIDFAMFPAFQESLRAAGCEPFLIRDREE